MLNADLLKSHFFRFILCVWIFAYRFAFTYLPHLCAWCPYRTEEDISSPETGVKGACESPGDS